MCLDDVTSCNCRKRTDKNANSTLTPSIYLPIVISNTFDLGNRHSKEQPWTFPSEDGRKLRRNRRSLISSRRSQFLHEVLGKPASIFPDGSSDLFKHTPLPPGRWFQISST